MIDLIIRMKEYPGYFTVPAGRFDARPIAEIACRVVTPEHGFHGTPYSGDGRFWHLDPMNDWHLFVIPDANGWHCNLQFRGNMLGSTPDDLLRAYAAVINHQCRLHL